MSVHFEKIDLAGPIAAFPTDPQVNAGFTGNVAVVLYTTTASTEVEISLDGKNVHGRLLAGSPGVSVAFENNTYQRVWLRTATAATVSVGVGVESSVY